MPSRDLRCISIKRDLDWLLYGAAEGCEALFRPVRRRCTERRGGAGARKHGPSRRNTGTSGQGHPGFSSSLAESKSVRTRGELVLGEYSRKVKHVINILRDSGPYKEE